MRRAIVAALLAAATLPAGAAAESAPDAGTAFVPQPLSKPLYDSKPPSEDPQRQRHIVKAHDGVDLYVETWLPAPKDGNVPPARVPVVLVMTPYVMQGVQEYAAVNELLNSYGYAVAQHHVRGTGESGGCLEQTAANQIDDGARVVEFLGRDAPYSDGNVGMFGISYDAETQISVAGFGDPEKIKYLKAMVPAASVGGQYEYSYFDGVPYAGQAATSNVFYLAGVSVVPGQTSTPGQYVQKLNCQGEVLTNSADPSGDMTPFWAAREYRPGAPRVKAATLYVHGLVDWNVQPITIAGWFDRLPDSTPHKGLFGVWQHAFPDRHSIAADWARADWSDMYVAWFDRYLKNLPTGVENWPDVQVQSSTGQWRDEGEWPATAGPSGQLGLAPGGKLGLAAPSGETTFIEASGQAVFTTDPVAAPLHLTGQPVLDLWLTSDKPDGHLASRIEVLDASGNVALYQGGEAIATYGFRSLQHRESLPDNHFRQARGVPSPVDEPFNVVVRFHPNDLVVPAGGRLRVTIAGQMSYSRDSLPSGSGATIRLHHDCGRPSALRFHVPTPGRPLINVREKDDDDPLSSTAETQPLEDGAGLSSGPLCGRPPVDPDMLGRTFTLPIPGPRLKPPACLDRTRPAITARRRGRRVTGTARDAGCNAAVARVEVAITRKAGKRCRHAVTANRFSKPVSCKRLNWLIVRGTSKWSLRLPRARRLTVRLRAFDAAANASRVRALRVR